LVLFIVAVALAVLTIIPAAFLPRKPAKLAKLRNINEHNDIHLAGGRIDKRVKGRSGARAESR
jgi:hypothetical protein